jgi:hypothetical protein
MTPMAQSNGIAAAQSHGVDGLKNMLRSATLSDLGDVVSWIATGRDCELWAGWRVSFPIDRPPLPGAIDFNEANAFSLAQAASASGSAGPSRLVRSSAATSARAFRSKRKASARTASADFVMPSILRSDSPPKRLQPVGPVAHDGPRLKRRVGPQTPADSNEGPALEAP